MKAILMRQTGGPEVLEYTDIEEPRLTGGHEIKVRLRAAGVNPVDTKQRARGPFAAAGLPTVLGCDGSGVVVETGTSVTQFSTGDRVWFCNGGLGGLNGNYAEYTIVDEAHCIATPDNVSDQTTAAAALVLLTAWEALFDQGKLESGQTTLIHAGAGGVGHVAIQLAKSVGARVITTVSSQEKEAFVRELGADEVINYTTTDFVEAVMDLTHGQGADVTLEAVNNEVFQRSINATAHYGSLVTLLDPGSQIAWTEARLRNLRIAFTLMLTPMLRNLADARAHQTEILKQCAAMMAEGRLKIHLSGQWPLAQAAEAHKAIAEGHVTGKLVLNCGS